MKAFFFVLSWGLGMLLAQVPELNQPASYYGAMHTPKGRIHTLVVFVRYEGNDFSPNNPVWPDETKEGSLPKMAIGRHNQLLSSSDSLLGTPAQIKNLTEYYHASSAGQFVLTGDIFPVQVPVKYTGNTFGMNQEAIQWIAKNYPDFDWKRYDNRTNTTAYLKDNSETAPDKIIDFILFLHRKPGSAGLGSCGAFPIPNTGYKIKDGYTGVQSFDDAEHTWELFRHEFAHCLYDCPHYMGANHATGDKFYINKGWGLMSEWHAPFYVANAWEKWWLGWMEVETVKKKGTYLLKDLTTGNQALRIQIPGTQDFLWLENHQSLNRWDKKIFFDDEKRGYQASEKGIYAYIVAEAGADRFKPKLSPFMIPHCNMFKLLHADGNYDFAVSGDTMQLEYFKAPVWEKISPNPIAGQNPFQSIRYDNNGDGKVEAKALHGNVDGKPGECTEVWCEKIGGENRMTAACNGAAGAAFQVGDEISLSGIVPALNYPVCNLAEQSFAPYLLNGIQIKVLSQNEKGEYTLSINFDDYEIRNSQRWCGNLKMPAKTPENKQWWTIKAGAEVNLDLSGTVNRTLPDPHNGTLASSTRLVIEANNGIRIESGATLRVANYSTLELVGNAQIVIEKGGSLIVEDVGVLALNEGTQIYVQKNGRLRLAKEARLREMIGSRILVEKGAKVKK